MGRRITYAPLFLSVKSRRTEVNATRNGRSVQLLWKLSRGAPYGEATETPLPARPESEPPNEN